MAAPNIVGVTSIYGKTSALIATTSAVALVANAASSGKVVKVNSITFANITAAAVSCTAYVLKAGTTIAYLAYQISVPANSTLVVTSKDTSFYLEENDSVLILASAGTALHAFSSYEEIS